MRDLLILGSRRDPHIAKVEQELRRLGLERVFVLDFFDGTFGLESSAGEALSITIDGTALRADPVIWDRANIEPGTILYPAGDDQEARALAAQEWRSLYRMILGAGSPIVVNSVESRQHLNKPRQQTIAASVGFSVPRTLVTNDRSEMLRFAEVASGSIVMKSLSGAKIRSQASDDDAHFNVMTMRVSCDDLAHATDAEVRYCPHFVQDEIIKDFELRIVWVDGTALAFRVGSQVYECSTVDWRHATRALTFEPYTLPETLERRLNAYMRASGLFSGSIDLIVDRKGDAWFLECNQQGAWGWLDRTSGGEIGRLFARKLRDLAVD